MLIRTGNLTLLYHRKYEYVSSYRRESVLVVLSMLMRNVSSQNAVDPLNLMIEVLTVFFRFYLTSQAHYCTPFGFS